MKVLDFIGSYKNADQIPRWLTQRISDYHPIEEGDINNKGNLLSFVCSQHTNFILKYGMLFSNVI